MKKIGVVLSGGLAKGAYQIGALEAIAEYFEPQEVFAVSASSVGALNAYAYFCGSLNSAKEMWTDINQFKKRVSVFTLLKSPYLQTVLEDLTTHDLLCEHFYMPLLQLRERKTLYNDLTEIDLTKRKDYLNAGVSFIKPYKLEGKYYFDGALADNIPIFPLEEHDLDYIICVYFDNCNYIFDSPEVDSRVIKIAFDEDNILSKSLIFSREATEKMIDMGKCKTKKILDFAFANGTEKEEVHKQIAALNKKNKNRKMRVTIDTALRSINALAKRLTKRTKQ